MMFGLVEETLRLAAAAQRVWRKVKSDAELGGVRIPAGAIVTPSTRKGVWRNPPS